MPCHAGNAYAPTRLTLRDQPKFKRGGTQLGIGGDRDLHRLLLVYIVSKMKEQKKINILMVLSMQNSVSSLINKNEVILSKTQFCLKVSHIKRIDKGELKTKSTRTDMCSVRAHP